VTDRRKIKTGIREKILEISQVHMQEIEELKKNSWVEIDRCQEKYKQLLD